MKISQDPLYLRRPHIGGLKNKEFPQAKLFRDPRSPPLTSVFGLGIRLSPSLYEFVVVVVCYLESWEVHVYTRQCRVQPGLVHIEDSVSLQIKGYIMLWSAANIYWLELWICSLGVSSIQCSITSQGIYHVMICCRHILIRLYRRYVSIVFKASWRNICTMEWSPGHWLFCCASVKNRTCIIYAESSHNMS